MIRTILHKADCLSPFIDETQYGILRKKLRKALQTFHNNKETYKVGFTTRPPKQTGIDILNAIFNSRIAKQDEEVRGSAMFPVSGNTWHIGGMGSVWLDVDVSGKMYRVAFNPQDNGFYVM